MGKQVRVFDLLTKKQSISVFKSQKKKNEIAEKLRLATLYEKQLQDILNSMLENKNHKTVAEIKSETWYKLKIQDELRANRNKIDFLNKEIVNQRMLVAKESEKRKKFSERKDYFKKLESQEKERKQENMTPSGIEKGLKP
ncbi:MAG: hypothetical protein VYE27_07550 [Pseudomonadota bacterium]|nr:hypothetical protein [Pseudomonadota bacterium]